MAKEPKDEVGEESNRLTPAPEDCGYTAESMRCEQMECNLGKGVLNTRRCR